MRYYQYFLYSCMLFIIVGCGSTEMEEEVESTTQTSVLSERVEEMDTNASLYLLDENRSDDLEIQERDQEQEEEHNLTQIIPIEDEEMVTVLPEENLSFVEEEIVSPTVPLMPSVVLPIEPEPEPEPMTSPSPTYRQKFINEGNCDQILDKVFLLICYDYQKKVAKSVAYTLEGDLMNELNIQERPSFYEEQDIEEIYRAKLADYRGSGYDRGHLAPDAAFDWSQESLDATYSLSNIIPQVPVVNRQMWVDAEGYARDKAIEFGELSVVNVIDYHESNVTIGEGNVTVSTGYYKILYNQDEAYQECFYYANDANASSSGDSLLMHVVDCDAI